MVAIGMTAVHAANTMRAEDKGSLVNRTKCAGEHFKNDLKTALGVTTISTVGAGLGYAAYKNPAACVKFAKEGGKTVAYMGKLLGKLKLPKAGKFIKSAAENMQRLGAKIIEKAPKYGKFGVIAAIGAAVLSATVKLASKQAYNAGKIDQKYIDNAKIEKMTGSVVV